MRFERPAERVAGIILAGLGGGLDPSIAVGDVIIDGLTPGISLPPLYRLGRIHTSAGIAATPAIKAELFSRTGTLAVDMEGDVVRRLATSLRVPFLHVRGISDASADSLDPALMGFIDDVGRVRPLSLAGTLLRRPRLIPNLIRLGSHSRLAAENMSALLAAMLRPDARGPERAAFLQWLERGQQ